MTPDTPAVKFIAHTGAYKKDSGAKTLTNMYGYGEPWCIPSDLAEEYVNVSWPLNDVKRPLLASHHEGMEIEGKFVSRELLNRWGNRKIGDIGSGGCAGYSHLNIPVRSDHFVGPVNHADYWAMDFMCGICFDMPEGFIDCDLDFGNIESHLEPAPRCLGAQGSYTAFGGSLPMHPCYVGFHGLGSGYPPPEGWPDGHYPLSYDSQTETFTPIMPGGGNHLFKAERKMLSILEDEYYGEDEIMFLNESIGECYLEYYDVCRVESWPGYGIVKSRQAGHKTIPERLTVNVQQSKELLPLAVQWVPMMQALAHRYVILQDGQNAFAPDLYWHMEHYQSAAAADGVKWTFYGGTNPNTTDEEKWHAFNADMGYTHTYGSRLFIFDVDVGIRDDGSEIGFNEDTEPPEDDFTVNLYSEEDAEFYGTIEYLENLLASYKYWGYPRRSSDKIAEGLFFGELLPTPQLILGLFPPTYWKNLKYDLKTGLNGPNVTENIILESPSVLHSFWRADVSQQGSKEADYRLMLVFSNFTGSGWNVKTEVMDVREYLMAPEKSVYYSYDYVKPGWLLKLVPIDPSAFQASAIVGPYSVEGIGIVAVDKKGVPPDEGSYAILNRDENADMIILDEQSGNENILSVIPGDGSIEYHYEDMIDVARGVISCDIGNIVDPDFSDLICLTTDGFKVISFFESGEFDTVMDVHGLFVNPVRMVRMEDSGKYCRYVVQDGERLKILRILHFYTVYDGNDHPSKGDQYIIDELNCIPVSFFEAEFVNEDRFADLAAVGQNGRIELMSGEDEMPESKAIIDLSWPVESLLFEDHDLDGDMDLVLKTEKGESGIFFNRGDWKFSREK